VLALIAILAVTFVFINKSNTGTATATPARATAAASASVSTTTAVALATQVGGSSIRATISAAATDTASPASPAPAPTQAVPIITRAPSTTAATASASRAAASPIAGSTRVGTPVATTTVALGQTWTDPSGRLKFQYPNGWTVTKLTNSQSNIVEVDGPDNVSFYVDIFKQSGTPTQELQDTTDARAKSTQLTFTSGPTADAKVGGEPGKMMTYTAKRTDQTAAATTDGVLWIVNHGSSEYDFEALAVGKHRAEIDAIVASIVFTG
jgi:hypothetical protein